MVKAFSEKKLSFRRQRACGRIRPQNNCKNQLSPHYFESTVSHKLFKSIIGRKKFFPFFVIDLCLLCLIVLDSQGRSVNLLEKMSKFTFINKILSLVSENFADQWFSN